MATRAQAPDRTVLIVFLALIALGGSNAVAIKLGNAELPPFWGATLRFGLAAVLMAALAVVRRPPFPRGRTLTGAFLYGLLNFAASYAFAYFGLVDAPASVAMLVIAIAPLLTLILATVHGIEAFRWQGLVGSVVAAAGIAIVFGVELGADVPPLALLALFAGAICIAETNVLAKLVPPGHPVSANLVGMTVGTVVLGLSRWLPASDGSCRLRRTPGYRCCTCPASGRLACSLRSCSSSGAGRQRPPPTSSS